MEENLKGVINNIKEFDDSKELNNNYCLLQIKFYDIPDTPSGGKDNGDIIYPQPLEDGTHVSAQKKKGEPYFGTINNPGQWL